ncbi:hypothetical protein ACFQWB_01640 [Paenibacillus thermoaerophilus]|uniref:Uncharacterized protein n=1 Tax=Paenibacillus thermoaerophilus TaxID=1215385 RepID=A0ABW2V314_9BACL|nr:hypothetical protein [Paenibacillus thermoaerophilus]TMV19055.1 hypothetical protein FE781_00660 [Paenibacillus thermoaerophilus]
MIAYGIAIDLPDGKLPGFYAQFVKKLAERVSLLDREKDILIARTSEEADIVLELLQRFNGSGEKIELLVLPEEAVLSPRFTDYGFTCRSGAHYAYAGTVSRVLVPDEQPFGAEPAPALEQMREHTLAEYADPGNLVLLAETQHVPLLAEIARAYGCVAHAHDD